MLLFGIPDKTNGINEGRAAVKYVRSSTQNKQTVSEIFLANSQPGKTRWE